MAVFHVVRCYRWFFTGIGFMVSLCAPHVALANTDAPAPLKVSAKFTLTLEEALARAFSQGQSIVSAVADFALQKQQIEEITRKEFSPKTVTTLNALNARAYGPDLGATTSRSAGASLTNSLKLRSGGQLSLIYDTSQNSSSSLAGVSKSSGLNASFRQPLLRGFGSVNTITLRSAEISFEVAKLNLEQLAVDTAFQVISAYSDFALANGRLRASRDALGRASELLKVSKALVDAGRKAKSELLQGELDVAQAEFNLAQTENDLAKLKRELVKLLGPASDLADVQVQEVNHVSRYAGMEIPAGLQAVELALAQRVDLRIAKENFQVTQMQREQALDGQRLPLDLTVSVKRAITASGGGTVSKKPDVSVGISTEIPFDTADKRYQLATSDAALAKASLQLEELSRNITTEAVDTVRQLQFAIQQKSLTDRTLIIARDRLDAELERYRSGRLSALDISNAQQSFAAAQDQSISVNNQVFRARLALERTTGTLLSNWKLQDKIKGWTYVVK